MELEISSATQSEKLYAFRQSTQIRAQTGCIGYLRADMDTNGEGFFSTWNDYRQNLKTQEFKDEFDEVINTLRDDGFLKNRTALSRYCYSHMEASYGDDREWAVRVNTEKYSYIMRLNPHKGEYNLYCYAYVKDWLDRHIERASQGIRFIDANYNEQFRIPDGDRVRIAYSDGRAEDRTARYIDEYHVELESYPSGNLYHICELAERLEQSGATIIPLRSSLPEKCFVYVESTDEVGVVTRGEEGYRPAGVKPENGITKRESVEYLNEAQGVSRAQAAAMSAGSIFGWNTKTADPKNYDDEGNLLKPNHRDRGEAR